MAVCRGSRRNRPARGGAGPFIEPLESRTLLSAGIVRPGTIQLDDSSADVQGFTPSQIRTAYGFNQVSFDNGATAGTGKGQTIAIVDAYNDPAVQSDLAVFDSQFGLAAPPNFQVVSQTGSGKLPQTNAGWANEIALDVEWAHAIAPDAGILLVESNTDNTDDLIQAVNYARSVSGVSVISMSWGGSEYGGQIQYDGDLVTPPGHAGVTFVAAAGDSGPGAIWPASSPEVLSVGGTSLTLSDSSGDYGSETSWSQTGGGYSTIESEPSYQQTAQNTGARGTPDVAYDADPNTGFAVYDSISYQGIAGWQVIGGTSAGAAQWAALIAIADQGRALSGLGTLDGGTQTLPTLYSLYAAPDSANYSAYTSDFHDVVDYGATRPGRHHQSGAVAGYDTATGLGSPQAAQIVSALVQHAVSGSAPVSTDSPALGAQITTKLPAGVVAGSAGTVTLRLTDSGTAAFDGPVSIALSVSTSSAGAPDDAAIQTESTPVKLKPRASRTITIHFTWPTDANGPQYLLASVSGTGVSTVQAASSSSVTLSPPRVDLAATLIAGSPITLGSDRPRTLTLVVQNLGNVAAVGTAEALLEAGIDSTPDSTDPVLTRLPSRHINLGAGKSLKWKLRFVPPPADSGDAWLIATVSSVTRPSDADAANNVAVIGIT